MSKAQSERVTSWLYWNLKEKLGDLGSQVALSEAQFLEWKASKVTFNWHHSLYFYCTDEDDDEDDDE